MQIDPQPPGVMNWKRVVACEVTKSWHGQERERERENKRDSAIGLDNLGITLQGICAL